MSRKLVIVISILLVFLVSCASVGAFSDYPLVKDHPQYPFDDDQLADAMQSIQEYAESVALATNTTNTTSFNPYSNNGPIPLDSFVPVNPDATDPPIMYVFYVITTGEFMFWFPADAEITDNGDTWDITSSKGSAYGVNKNTITYGIYQYQVIVIEYDENGVPLPVYIQDLGLQTPTGIDLPHSQHIGMLTAVNPTLIKPATVIRRFQGVNYEVQCLVSQSAVDMWLAGTLQVGDYVIVSFIDEIPGTQEYHIPVVVDKVFESWS